MGAGWFDGGRRGRGEGLGGVYQDRLGLWDGMKGG